MSGAGGGEGARIAQALREVADLEGAFVQTVLHALADKVVAKGLDAADVARRLEAIAGTTADAHAAEVLRRTARAISAPKAPP